ncbi:ferrichrome outer membrane transporter [Klebsiella pneumoniae]|nr:ferrichrome outer membrane transporter [Klebsiella pneumoniae]
MARPKTAQPNHSLRKVAAVVATAVSGMSVYAQAAEQPKQEETITVVAAPAAQESAWGPAPTIAAKRSATATKTDTPIEKTPQSVSVVTRQEMEMRQPTTVKEALSYTPSVFSTRGSSTTYDVVTIRGFTTSTTVNTNQYLDGMKLQGNNYSEVSMDPYFLERVEVMRGPTSVLYGNSNPGGIVSMVSKRPTTEPLKEVQFKMGTDNLWQTGFDFSDAIDDAGVWSYRLTGLGRSQDAQQQMAKSTRYAVAPSFSWRPDDKTDFTFLSNFQNDPDAGYYGWLPREGTVVPYYDANGKAHKLPTDFNEGESDNKISRRQKMVGYSFSHQFDDTFTVRQNLRYADVHTLYRSVYGNGYVAPGYMNRAYVRSDEHLNTFTVDTQLQSDFATGAVSHTLLTGVDYSRMRNDVDADYGTADPISMSNPQYGNPNIQVTFPYAVLNRMEQTGLYAQDQMEWDKWVMTLGGRYDYATTSTLTRATNSLAENHDQQFSWRGGINYLFDNGISPYFSYSESFEPVSGSNSRGQPFDPSRGKQYEAGVKYVPKDMPVVVTAAVYQLTKDKNLTADPANQAFSIQTGEIRSRGLELEAKAAVNANINVTAAYSYTDAEYTHDTVFNGKRPAEVPRNMASLWADYTFHETALSGLTIGAGARYIGSTVSYYKNDTSTGKKNDAFSVAGYALMDATVKYDLARFGLPGSSVGVNVNNLFDREICLQLLQRIRLLLGCRTSGRRHRHLPFLTTYGRGSPRPLSGYRYAGTDSARRNHLRAGSRHFPCAWPHIAPSALAHLPDRKSHRPDRP